MLFICSINTCCGRYSLLKKSLEYDRYYNNKPSPHHFGCTTNPSSTATMKSFDHWSNLVYNFRGSASGFDGVWHDGSASNAELTPQMYAVQKAQAQANLFTGLLSRLVTAAKCGTRKAGSSIPFKFNFKDDLYFIYTTYTTYSYIRINHEFCRW